MIPERHPGGPAPRPGLVTALALGRVGRRGRRWGRPAHSLLVGPGPVQPRRVLCCDRDPGLAESLAAGMRHAGLDARACGGVGGLVGVTDFRPHACVFDLDTPDVAGCELARWARSELGGLVFLVALADRPGHGLDLVAAEAGFDLLLPRPADAGLLAGLLAGPGPTRPG